MSKSTAQQRAAKRQLRAYNNRRQKALADVIRSNRGRKPKEKAGAIGEVIL